MSDWDVTKAVLDHLLEAGIIDAEAHHHDDHQEWRDNLHKVIADEIQKLYDDWNSAEW